MVNRRGCCSCSCSLARRRDHRASPARARRPRRSTISSISNASAHRRFRRTGGASPTPCARPTGTRTPTRPKSGSATRNGTRQLTNAQKSSLQPAWSPDGRWLAFISDRDGKRQIYRIADRGRRSRAADERRRGRERVCLVAGRRAHRLHDDRSGRRQRQGAREDDSARSASRIEDRRMAHSTSARRSATRVSRVRSPRARSSSAASTGRPTARSIAFDHRISSDPADSGSADISVVDVATRATHAVRRRPERPRHQPALVARRHAHRVRLVDGQAVLLSTRTA